MNTKWEGCYTDEELELLGLKSFGKNTLISKNAKIYNPKQLSVGDNVRIDDFSILTGDIELGSYVHIGSFCMLSGRYEITMKNFTALAARVSIYTGNDDYSNGTSLTNPTIPDKFHKIIKGKVILEEHVLIGAGCIILPGAHLNKGITTGAHSLIQGKEYEGWNLYVGNPIRKLKKRPRDIILRDAKKLIS